MTDVSPDYSATIEVLASPDQCFEAITQKMNAWWTATTEGDLSKVGNKIKVIFAPSFGYWTFEAVTLNAGKSIEMDCVDAHHHVEGQPKSIDQEWLGTRIIWNIAPYEDRTRVSMTHVGLTPQLNCWGICMDGWNHFFGQSLKDYLNGKDASPHKAD